MFYNITGLLYFLLNMLNKKLDNKIQFWGQTFEL